jgi:hypothetical protein
MLTYITELFHKERDRKIDPAAFPMTTERLE